MGVFNHTFDENRPIYYPATWGTGKTAPQLYEEFKQTYQFFILSNLVQILCAGFWLFLVYVLFNAIKEMIRLYSLPDTNRQKIANRQYISRSFIMSTIFIGFIIMFITCGLLYVDQFTKYAIIKGFFAWIFTLLVFYSYRVILNKYKMWKMQKNQYKKVKKQQQ